MAQSQLLGQADGELLLPTELQGVGRLAGQEAQGQDAHPQQLGLVELLEALGDDGSHPLRRAAGGEGSG